jgi:hypothetical protein
MLKHDVGAAGEIGAYLDRVEADASEHGLTVTVSDDRHRLAYLHGGRPSFPGWYPRSEGGADGFWIDFRARSGRTEATGGALVYALGPVTLTDFINAGGMDLDIHEIRIGGEAADEASAIRMEVGFSGNLIVFDADDRKTAKSAWLTRTVPLLNKAILTALYPSVETFITFVRDAQLDHLAPRYGLPVMVPGVRWSRRFQGSADLHLGVQTRDELLSAIRSRDSRPTQLHRASAA